MGFAADFYLSEAQNLIPPSVNVYAVYLFTQGRGVELIQREGERGNTGEYISQAGLNILT